MEQVDLAVGQVLASWEDLRQYEETPYPDDLTIVYRLLEKGLPKPEEATACSKLVRETLGKWCNPVRCVARLLETYPMQRFSVNQVKRCLHIFRLIVRYCSYIDMQDDAQVEFGFEDYYPMGHFQIKRSKVLQDLLNAPEVKVLCFDIDQQEGPNFTLLELLTQDQAYDTFMEVWEKRPAYDFTAEEQVEELEVKITRVERVMEETKKMNEKLISSMKSMTDGFQGFSEELFKKSENLKDITLAKQSEHIEQLRQKVVTTAKLAELAATKAKQVTDRLVQQRKREKELLKELKQTRSSAKKAVRKAEKKAKKAKKARKKLQKKLKKSKK